MSHAQLLAQLRAKPWEEIPLETPLSIEELPTPALVLDLAAMDANIERMTTHLVQHGKGARPHGKTHKCPLIAHRLMAAGAVGICVAKLGEAAAMAHAGLSDLLITSPITHPQKAAILAGLLDDAPDLKIVVDTALGADVLFDAIPTDRKLGVVLDIDVEMGRTGNRSADEIRQLADRFAADPRFEVAGVQHYAGHLQHVQDFAERRERSLASWTRAIETAREALGSLPDIVTGCGTGTHDIDVEIAEITDLQVGSFIFMDREYLEIGGAGGGAFDRFRSSLTVACSAISEPTTRAVTVDGGYKAFASDTVTPAPMDLPDARFHFAGDEHGVLVRPKGDQEPLLGRVLQFIVPHCDPTVNLHDYYFVQDEDGLVRRLWPVTARGCAW